MLEFKTIVVGTILLFIALVAGPYFAAQFDTPQMIIPLGPFRLIGVLMMLFGAPLAAWCSYLLLVPGKGKIAPFDPVNELKIAGPYNKTRNPFMLGWLFILWGEVVFLRSISILIYALILTLCVHFWVIAFEEPSLEDKYGEEYKKYKLLTPRWFPHLFKKHQ